MARPRRAAHGEASTPETAVVSPSSTREHLPVRMLRPAASAPRRRRPPPVYAPAPRPPPSPAGPPPPVRTRAAPPSRGQGVASPPLAAGVALPHPPGHT